MEVLTNRTEYKLCGCCSVNAARREEEGLSCPRMSQVSERLSTSGRDTAGWVNCVACEYAAVGKVSQPTQLVGRLSQSIVGQLEKLDRVGASDRQTSKKTKSAPKAIAVGAQWASLDLYISKWI